MREAVFLTNLKKENDFVTQNWKSINCLHKMFGVTIDSYGSSLNRQMEVIDNELMQFFKIKAYEFKQQLYQSEKRQIELWNERTIALNKTIEWYKKRAQELIISRSYQDKLIEYFKNHVNILKEIIEELQVEFSSCKEEVIKLEQVLGLNINFSCYEKAPSEVRVKNTYTDNKNISIEKAVDCFYATETRSKNIIHSLQHKLSNMKRSFRKKKKRWGSNVRVRQNCNLYKVFIDSLNNAYHQILNREHSFKGFLGRKSQERLGNFVNSQFQGKTMRIDLNKFTIRDKRKVIELFLTNNEVYSTLIRIAQQDNVIKESSTKKTQVERSSYNSLGKYSASYLGKIVYNLPSLNFINNKPVDNSKNKHYTNRSIYNSKRSLSNIKSTHNLL